MKLRRALPALLLSISTSMACAENWPQWRGPRGNGISAETGIATKWSRTENVAWRLPLPGPGGATPVVWGDRIFLTSSVGEGDGADLVLLCASTDGKEMWRKEIGTGNQNARTTEGNSASPSPCTDGEHVWCFFGTGVLACHDFSGEEVWKFNVQDRYGKFDIQFGMTSTPVLDGDALYLQFIHGKWGGDYRVGKVVRLKKATGEEVWAVDRPTNAEDECKHSYASPILYDDGRERFLLTHGGDCTVAHDLETGRELGRLSELNGPSSLNKGSYDNTFRFIATPSGGDGFVVVPTAKGGPLVAVNVRDDIDGDVNRHPDAIRWTYRQTPDVSIPLIHDGVVYCLMKNGQVFVLDADSGKELNVKRIHGAEHRASPVYADGHIYLCARDGVCTVLKAGPELEVVAENSIGDEPITASPVISDGTLYLRSFDALYAIRP